MLYFFQLSFFALLTILLSVLTIICGIFETHGKKAYRINQFWTWIILRVAGIRLKVDGLENVDPKRQYVFIVNHQSNIDIPVLVQALAEFQLRWMAKKELLRVPFFGWAMWATKHVTVDRSDPQDAVKSLARAKERLGAGISLVIYPEGTRSRDGRLQRFKKGGFLLAVQANTPIVPVTVNGSAKLLPAGAWRLRPGTIDITIDKPVSVEGFRPGNLRLLVNQVHATIDARRHTAEPGAGRADIFEDSAIGHEPIEKPSM
ncbi:MAG: 1-acyl-sn-glycerol-3-phosphate acyltransferase [Deltaproteobacteria bacterium]|nr:1-acyl-sn-glycerol-3-phosphate acyltransferase [Deltaproteobacteria bacterium]